MRKLLAAAALTASVATGLAVSAPAQAATSTTVSTSTFSSNWGKYYSDNNYAYNYGKVYKSHGKVYTKWYGVDRHSGGHGYVWFGYYKNGSWHKFSQSFEGHGSGLWSGSGIKKIYTYTCWGSKFDHCGDKHFIY
ncbi:hypothetical protein ACIBG8_24915 [Nonomuraea sp. NPDC050556]|uniref:hypothetical protein n=1 Tax=Nonomuraea sp. NPDC050556 TaxID=3364369 RepID=UPI003790475E